MYLRLNFIIEFCFFRLLFLRFEKLLIVGKVVLIEDKGSINNDIGICVLM